MANKKEQVAVNVIDDFGIVDESEIETPPSKQALCSISPITELSNNIAKASQPPPKPAPAPQQKRNSPKPPPASPELTNKMVSGLLDQLIAVKGLLGNPSDTRLSTASLRIGEAISWMKSAVEGSAKNPAIK